jgi:hypothetical protein
VSVLENLAEACITPFLDHHFGSDSPCEGNYDKIELFN